MPAAVFIINLGFCFLFLVIVVQYFQLCLTLFLDLIQTVCSFPVCPLRLRKFYFSSQMPHRASSCAVKLRCANGCITQPVNCRSYSSEVNEVISICMTATWSQSEILGFIVALSKLRLSPQTNLQNHSTSSVYCPLVSFRLFTGRTCAEMLHEATTPQPFVVFVCGKLATLTERCTTPLCTVNTTTWLKLSWQVLDKTHSLVVCPLNNIYF